MSSLAPGLSVLELTVSCSTISIGKYGSFQANQIIGRPYHLTFEILDTVDDTALSSLRVVAPEELYADINSERPTAPSEVDDGGAIDGKGGVEYAVVRQDGEVVLRTNREIVDDPSTQMMTMDEIEMLKAEGTGSGKDLITKILDSHSALDQKTAYALAKYTLRKAKKYMRRFMVLPVDVPLLAKWILTEKEPKKIMELREEMIALIGSWSNVHFVSSNIPPYTEKGSIKAREGRWLVIDETAGLLVAAMAERMGILDSCAATDSFTESEAASQQGDKEPEMNGGLGTEEREIPKRAASIPKSAALAESNSITLIHANAQPNLSLLSYFGYDASNPRTSHTLQRHLRTISWLQLLAPIDDNGYAEPDTVPNEVLQSWKSGKRGNYYRKRRRWERTKSVVDETRAGDFDGLVIATVMGLATVLHHTVPLLRGAAQVVIYSPNVEPLAELTDYYSTARRAAFVTRLLESTVLPTEDFPLNPTLLLAPTIQTARCRSWQVLPGRTHPLMTGRGGSEGYIFTATRVIPADGKIEARGHFKRRKLASVGTRESSQRLASVDQGEQAPIEASLE